MGRDGKQGRDGEQRLPRRTSRNHPLPRRDGSHSEEGGDERHSAVKRASQAVKRVLRSSGEAFVGRMEGSDAVQLAREKADRTAKTCSNDVDG